MTLTTSLFIHHLIFENHFFHIFQLPEEEDHIFVLKYGLLILFLLVLNPSEPFDTEIENVCMFSKKNCFSIISFIISLILYLKLFTCKYKQINMRI